VDVSADGGETWSQAEILKPTQEEWNRYLIFLFSTRTDFLLKTGFTTEDF
jgi:hypothetical protein